MANPRDKETVVEKIKNGDVKVKRQKQTHASKANAEQPASTAAQATTQAKTVPSEREKLNYTEDQLITAVKTVGHPASSREISDKLGIKDPDQGRAFVRSRMEALVKEKKIVTSKPDGKSLCTFLYSVA